MNVPTLFSNVFFSNQLIHITSEKYYLYRARCPTYEGKSCVTDKKKTKTT